MHYFAYISSRFSGSKLLFDFVIILERGFYTGGIWDFCFNDSEIQKSKNTVKMFLGITGYRNQSEWYINTPPSKNLPNIDRNKTVGVCKSGEENPIAYDVI